MDKRAVIIVGPGRGFVVEHEREGRFVITAAHCLPFFPPCFSATHLEERTYQRLLGPLGGDATVSAECLFVDPIADIAVLGSPDSQALFQEAEAYEAFVEEASALKIGALPDGDGFKKAPLHPGFLLSLDGNWNKCAVQVGGNDAWGRLWIRDAKEGIVGGMSGSPILVQGKAVGLVSVSGGAVDGLHNEGGPNPRLTANLPSGLLSRLACKASNIAKLPNLLGTARPDDDAEENLSDKRHEAEDTTPKDTP
jgi:hypothetical protein